jgi:hypothetical protein
MNAAYQRKRELELQQKYENEFLAKQEEERQKNESILAKKAQEILELQASNEQLRE